MNDSVVMVAISLSRADSSRPPSQYAWIFHLKAPNDVDDMKPPIRAYIGEEAYVFICYAHADASEVYPDIR
jgi:hypothetical protein